ncbi:MATE family efflux transporter, partial [Pyramidobacter piscolens]
FAGDAAVSGVSLVNMLAVFFLYVFTALASGGAVVVSQYIGGKNGRGAEHSAGQLLMISTMVSALCSAAILTWNREILQLLFGRVEKSVMQACMTYQRISAYSFAALGIYNAGAAVCRSEGKTSVTLKIAVFSNIVNVAGNALGIFVFHAGVAGVAWPTVIARVFSAVAVTCFCLRPGNGVRYTKSDVFSYDSAAVKKILHIAVPNSVENGAFQLIKVALSSITAMFGTAQITANGIAQSLWSLAALVVMTMGPVYITVIGQCMGAGDVQDAERYFRKLTRITLLCAVAWNSLILALTPLAMRFYPLSGEIRRMVIELVLIHNVFNALVWPFGGALPNGLRAAGDVKYTMKVAVLSTVCVRLALSVVLSVWMRMGVFGIAWAMVCDWIVRGVLYVIRYRRGQWKTMRVI